MPSRKASKSARKGTVEVACVQLSASHRSKEAQTQHAVSLIENLDDVDLVVLPELWPTGYFSFHRYAVEAETVSGPTVRAIAAVARRRRVHIVGGSVVERGSRGRLYNMSFLVSPKGKVLLTYRKLHLFGYRSREAKLLAPGSEVRVARTALGCLAMTTCYDLRFPELYRLIVEQGAEIIIVVSAWPWARRDHWLLLTRARALENQVFLIACNAVGNDSGTKLAGSSLVVDPWGEILGVVKKQETILRVSLDMSRLRRIRKEFPVLRDRRIRVTAQGIATRRLT